jgi:16S rRNA processing protein RimM
LNDVLKKGPVLLGKIAATQGIRGQLRVKVYSGNLDTLSSIDFLKLKGPDGVMKTFQISSAALHGKKFIISFEGYDNINQVLPLVGHEIYVNRDQLPALTEGEYYWCDLVGVRVETDDGRSLGELAEIIETGSNDVYVVRGGGREYLIPALEEVVLKIDLAAGIMKVSPPEGLLDL